MEGQMDGSSDPQALVGDQWKFGKYHFIGLTQVLDPF